MKHNEIILENQAHPRLAASTTTNANNGTAQLYVDTGSGYIQIGPGNSAHCHIQTDISNFYFNKELRVNSGIIGSYDEDLQLRRANNSSHQLVITTTAVTTPLNFDAAGYVEGANFKVNTIEVIDSSRVLKNITRADFANFTVTGTNTTTPSYLRYANIAANVEGSHMSHPYFFNDLANFAARGGTVTIAGLNTTPAMTKPFDASPDFAGWAANNYTGSTMTLTLTNLPKALSYGGYIGIAFGNTGWAPASCKIEVSTDGGSSWTTRLNDSSKNEIYFTTTGAGGTGINAIRFTLGQPTSSLRLTNIWAYNYNSAGMEEYFLSKGGGRVWGDVAIGSNIEAGSKLKLYNNGNTKMTIECNDSSSAYINFTGVSNEMSLGYDRPNSRMAFTNHDTLGSNIRMILKSNGDWVVSNTDARVATQFNNQAGIGWYETNQNMQIATTNASSPAVEIGLNHSTSNATFLNFRKQATIRGSIGIEGNDSLIIQSTGSTGAGLRFHPSSGAISPIRNGSLSNETISLGTLTQSFNTAFVKKGYFHGGKNPQSGTWGGDPFVTVGGFESTGNHDGSDAMAGFSLGVVSIGNNGGSTPTMKKNQVWTTGGISGNAYNSSVRWDVGRWEHNSTNSRTRLDLYLADQNHTWYLNSSWKVDGGSPRLGIGTVSPEDTLHVNGGSYATYFTGAAASDPNRYRFYGNSSSYTIGMVSSNTFGGLGGWAMAFKFSDNAERGFVWRDSAHSLNGGAMAVTTNGKLTVAHSARIGYGETDTTVPGASYRLDVNGNANFAASSSDQTSSSDSTSVPSTTGAAVMRLNGGYTDGRYATEFVKVDRIGNLPLYIRESTGTANSFSNVARFGAHSNTGDSTRTNRFYVFGNMGASGSCTADNYMINGNQIIDSSQNITTSGDITTGGNIIIDGNSKFLVIENHAETESGIVFNDGDAGNWPASSSQAFKMQYNAGGDSGLGSMIMGHDDDSYSGFDFAKGGRLRLNDGTLALPSYSFISDPDSGITSIASNAVGFITGGVQRFKINSNGLLLTGTSSLYINGQETISDTRSIANVVNYENTDGHMTLNRTGNAALIINRKGTTSSSKGELLNFKSQNVKVGRIGYVEPYGGVMYMATGNTSGYGLGIYHFATASYIFPTTHTGAINDNAMDIGGTSSRFDDVYATNGTIQTSDRNEKQDIQALTDAEQAAAVACKALVRRFRWIDSVEEKGDNARYHFGVIAQDVEDAFTAEGLDAGDYGLFIRSTWWEHEGHSYPSEEAAPTGAVEKTRLGIRYNQLFAFIISAL